MVHFLAGAAASEVYREAIEQEVGRELTSVARECRVQTSVQLLLCPTLLSSAPKRKQAIRCWMGFYSRQSELHTNTHMHIKPWQERCAERGAPREARETRQGRQERQARYAGKIRFLQPPPPLSLSLMLKALKDYFNFRMFQQLSWLRHMLQCW